MLSHFLGCLGLSFEFEKNLDMIKAFYSKIVSYIILNNQLLWMKQITNYLDSFNLIVLEYNACFENEWEIDN